MSKNLKVKDDTIAAQATPPGKGGVGIVRVSGPKVSEITEKILGKKIEVRQATFSDFFSHDKQIIDQGLAIYFAAPNSFTGEDLLELQGHGGQAVMDLLLQRVLELGARVAYPGEFTQKAFLNGKLDLVQAEAVGDLINAATSQAAKNATRSLQGEFSRKVEELVEDLTNLRVRIESAIDFVEEDDIEITTIKKLHQNLEKIQQKIFKLIEQAEQGVIIQEGITIVITGDPNVGKSSLFNYLSGQDKAIVTNIPGTTRDLLQSSIQLDGLVINLLDTAGLRDQPDLIEAEGIRRAKEEIKKADYVLLMMDVSRDDALKKIPQDSRQIVLYNKIDLTKEKARIEKIDGVDCIYLSVKNRQGLDLLKDCLTSRVGLQNVEQGFSARKRHLQSLINTKIYLQNIDGLLESSKLELIAEELKEAQNVLGEITGRVISEDLLDKIFSEFCIGK